MFALRFHVSGVYGGVLSERETLGDFYVIIIYVAGT